MMAKTLGKITDDSPNCPHCDEPMVAAWDAMSFNEETNAYDIFKETVYACLPCLDKVATNGEGTE